MGADAALANVYGYTPLILSAQFGYEEIAKILLYRDPGTLKHCCIGHNTCGMLLKLLKSVMPFEYCCIDKSSTEVFELTLCKVKIF